jgi:hypothetical protein
MRENDASANPATKDEYEFFQRLYEEEERTATELEGRAKVYLGIVSAFLVALFLKTDEVISSAAKLKIWFPLLLVLGLFLSIALVLIMAALRMRAAEAVNDGEALINDYEDWPTEAEFFGDRIADYAVASSRNRDLNGETAILLIWASRLLICGMLLIVVIAVAAVWRYGR